MPLDIGAMLLYTELFLPCGIFALFHLQTFSPRLEFAQTML